MMINNNKMEMVVKKKINKIRDKMKEIKMEDNKEMMMVNNKEMMMVNNREMMMDNNKEMMMDNNKVMMMDNKKGMMMVNKKEMMEMVIKKVNRNDQKKTILIFIRMHIQIINLSYLKKIFIYLHSWFQILYEST